MQSCWDDKVNEDAVVVQVKTKPAVLVVSSIKNLHRQFKV